MLPEKTKIKQAVILAGGQGVRMRPLTNDRPKPMVEVNGRPFLEYLIELLKDNDIEEIVLLLGYMSEKITEHFGDGKKFGVNIKYSITPVEDETGTRIKKVENLLQDKFLLLYADNYWPLNLKGISDFYESKGTLASITVYSNKQGISKGNIFLGEDGLVKMYDNSRMNPKVNGVEIGFYILDKKVLGLMPSENFSFEKEILPQLIAMGQLAGYSTDHRHYGLTTPDTIMVMADYLVSLENKNKIENA